MTRPQANPQGGASQRLRVVTGGQDDVERRNALARSILAHADGHEQRAVREALAALDGAGIDEIARARDED